MAYTLTIDGARVAGDHGDVVSPDPVEEAYRRCRERHGGLSVSLDYFRREVLEALDGAPVSTLDRCLVAEDLYVVLACKAGSEAAWRLFDRAYRGYLLRLATRYAGSRMAAEDLITDLYHDLVTRPARPGKLERYKGYAALSTWLAVIVRRMAMDRGRMAERRENRLQRLGRERKAVREPADPETALLGAEAARVAGELFRDAFRGLAGRHAVVLSLVYRDGLTLREAGRIMRLDYSTVSRRAKVARRALHEAMVRLGAERYGLAEPAVAALFADGAPGAEFERGEQEGTG